MRQIYRLAVLRATRPSFLVLAPLCVLLGIALAARQPVPLSLTEVVLVLVGGLLAHAAVNLLNEYDDFRSGLCAGVTVYKGLKMTDTRPGQWVVISGIGGLGHMAVQYAKAMGLNVAAVDIDDGKLALAERLGATVTVNAMKTDPAAYLKKTIGGAHGALVTAVSPKAFDQAQNMLRRGGTLVLNGLPPGDFPLPIFSTVLNGITIRGSIVGTRSDLQEALDFAAEGKVTATVATDTLDNINDVFQRMIDGKIEGRIVLDMAS